MEWIPHRLNNKADYISRIQDFNDWSTSPQFFSWVDSLLDPHSMDCSAHSNNAKLPEFYSRFWHPGSSAIDAFTVNWAGDVNRWIPPFNLVGRVLRHAEICNAVGNLVIPSW